MKIPSTRSEALVAYARLLLVLVSAVALTIDPSGPASLARVREAVFIAYGVYACVAAFAASGRFPPALRWMRATHVIDFVCITILNGLTTGTNSPLFLFFVFLMFCSTLRFGWRETAGTAAATLFVYAAMGYAFLRINHDPTFEVNRFIVRLAYVATVGALLIYLDRQRERMEADIGRAAGWPRETPVTIDLLARELLDYASVALRAPTTALSWQQQEADEGGYHATLTGENFAMRHVRDNFEVANIARDLRERSFLTRGGSTIAVDDRSPAPFVWRGAPLIGELARNANESTLSAPVRTETTRGRLYAFGRPFATVDLASAQLVASLIASRLDHYTLLQRIREAATEEERSRLADDIHDGVLQSLAAVSLQLRRLGSVVDRDPATARELAAKLEDMVSAAQRDLRLVLRNETRPGRSSLQSGVVSQFDEFRDLGVDIDLRVGDVPPLPPDARQQIQKIIREAVANAAKHAAASRVKVEIGSDDGLVRLTITDDGRGFPVHGAYTLDEMLSTNSGPKAITRRVAEMGGTMTLETDGRGTRVDLRLPLKA
jgi:signal transduction histidine kinase